MSPAQHSSPGVSAGPGYSWEQLRKNQPQISKPGIFPFFPTSQPTGKILQQLPAAPFAFRPGKWEEERILRAVSVLRAGLGRVKAAAASKGAPREGGENPRLRRLLGMSGISHYYPTSLVGRAPEQDPKPGDGQIPQGQGGKFGVRTLRTARGAQPCQGRSSPPQNHHPLQRQSPPAQHTHPPQKELKISCFSPKKLELQQCCSPINKSIYFQPDICIVTPVRPSSNAIPCPNWN